MTRECTWLAERSTQSTAASLPCSKVRKAAEPHGTYPATGLVARRAAACSGAWGNPHTPPANIAPIAKMVPPDERFLISFFLRWCLIFASSYGQLFFDDPGA